MATVGPATSQNDREAGHQGQRISLCMIVRDEEAMLPAFLRNAEGLWDELIVVDTGSMDSTVAIAERAGAQVLRTAWTDDFAAARNVGLEAARGDWIVFFDADEILSDDVKQQMRATASDPSAGAATVVMRNQLPHGNVHIAHLLRMFRRYPAVRFRYPIHEEIWSSVDPWLHRQRQNIKPLSGHVEHVGYQPERALQRKKKERDLQLLRKCLAAQPEDLYSWYKLLEVAQFWRDHDLLVATAGDAHPVLTRLSATALADFPFAGELLVLLSRGLFGSDDEACLNYLMGWSGRIPPSAQYHLRCAELWESLAEPLRAAAEFCKCLALADITRDRQLATIRPLLGLSRLAMDKGDLWEAWRHTESALKCNPCDREALLSALFICRQAAGRGGVDDFVRAYEMVHGATQELSTTLAELAGQPGFAGAELAAAV